MSRRSDWTRPPARQAPLGTDTQVIPEPPDLRRLRADAEWLGEVNPTLAARLDQAVACFEAAETYQRKGAELLATASTPADGPVERAHRVR